MSSPPIFPPPHHSTVIHRKPDFFLKEEKKSLYQAGARSNQVNSGKPGPQVYTPCSGAGLGSESLPPAAPEGEQVRRQERAAAAEHLGQGCSARPDRGQARARDTWCQSPSGRRLPSSRNITYSITWSHLCACSCMFLKHLGALLFSYPNHFPGFSRLDFCSS